MDDIINTVKFLEDSGLLIKSVSEAVENQVKEQKEGFFGMFPAILGARNELRITWTRS